MRKYRDINRVAHFRSRKQYFALLFARLMAQKGIDKHSMQDDNHTHLLEHEWIFPRVFARNTRHA